MPFDLKLRPPSLPPPVIGPFPPPPTGWAPPTGWDKFFGDKQTGPGDLRDTKSDDDLGKAGSGVFSSPTPSTDSGDPDNKYDDASKAAQAISAGLTSPIGDILFGAIQESLYPRYNPADPNNPTPDRPDVYSNQGFDFSQLPGFGDDGDSVTPPKGDFGIKLDTGDSGDTIAPGWESKIGFDFNDGSGSGQSSDAGSLDGSGWAGGDAPLPGDGGGEGQLPDQGDNARLKEDVSDGGDDWV